MTQARSNPSSRRPARAPSSVLATWLVNAPSAEPCPTSGPDLATVKRALPRPLAKCLRADGWTLDAITAQGTLIWARDVRTPHPDGWTDANHWSLRKAIRAYGLGTQTVGHDGARMVMFKATPFVVARPVDRARTDHTLLFDAHGRLPSAALIVDGHLVMPPVKRVNTRWHERLLVEPLDIAGSASTEELGMWLRHAFAESGINPYPEADARELDRTAGPYELAFPVLEHLARSVDLLPLAAVLRAAHHRMKAWAMAPINVPQSTERHVRAPALARR